MTLLLLDQRRFSALQRAENSSIHVLYCKKQPSSRFSALQRAENSSMDVQVVAPDPTRHVSVLFSEPKIPQYRERGGAAVTAPGFSALQRAENSSISFVVHS